MQLDVELIRAREFIRIGPKGRLDLARSRAILKQLSSACRKRGTEKALVDLRDVHSDFGPEELASCLELFKEFGSPYIKKLALLHGADDFRRVRTLALMASLRGWDVRAFDSFESAFDWLALKTRSRNGNHLRAHSGGGHYR